MINLKEHQKKLFIRLTSLLTGCKNVLIIIVLGLKPHYCVFIDDFVFRYDLLCLEGLVRGLLIFNGKWELIFEMI